MLKNTDRHYAKKRKKLWDHMGWHYLGIGYLSNNHSLNCGCASCRDTTYMRRKANKKQRADSRMYLIKELRAA